MQCGDYEACIVNYCLHKFHILPHEFLALPIRERAFIIASVQLRIEAEKEQEKKLKSKKRS